MPKPIRNSQAKLLSPETQHWCRTQGLKQFMRYFLRQRSEQQQAVCLASACVHRCAGHLKLDLGWLLFCIQFEQIIALQSNCTKTRGRKRPSLLFGALFKIQLIMLPEKCGKCGQIVLKLPDYWGCATRNDLLFIFILD